MTASLLGRFRRLAPAALIALALLLAGCFRGPNQAPPVDPEAARAALKAALDSWKKGEAPAALRGRSPAITVQDLDWEAGYRLLDYQLAGDGALDDANLRCPVRLTLRDPQGKEVKRSVRYVVGTRPAVTVFRELF